MLLILDAFIPSIAIHWELAATCHNSILRPWRVEASGFPAAWSTVEWLPREENTHLWFRELLFGDFSVGGQGETTHSTLKPSWTELRWAGNRKNMTKQSYQFCRRKHAGVDEGDNRTGCKQKWQACRDKADWAVKPHHRNETPLPTQTCPSCKLRGSGNIIHKY